MLQIIWGFSDNIFHKNMLKPHYNCLAIVIMKGNLMFSARNKNIKNISTVLGHNMF